MIAGRPGSSASGPRRARTASTAPHSAPTPASACSHPNGVAKYEPSNAAKVPGVNPTAIVRVWCGARSCAVAVTTAPPPASSVRVIEAQASVAP